MRMDAHALLEQAYAAYGRGDVEACAAFVTDDVVCAQYLDRDVAPFGGVSIGKGVLKRRWDQILGQFTIMTYRLEQLAIDEDFARALIHYHYRHKATGETIEGRLRHELWLRDGLIARYNEYLDRPRVEAFMRLVALGSPATTGK